MFVPWPTRRPSSCRQSPVPDPVVPAPALDVHSWIDGESRLKITKLALIIAPDIFSTHSCTRPRCTRPLYSAQTAPVSGPVSSHSPCIRPRILSQPLCPAPGPLTAPVSGPVFSNRPCVLTAPVADPVSSEPLYPAPCPLTSHVHCTLFSHSPCVRPRVP